MKLNLLKKVCGKRQLASEHLLGIVRQQGSRQYQQLIHFVCCERAFHIPKKEFLYLGTAFVASILVLKIVFYKEAFANLFLVVFGFFWLFVVPGYALTLCMVEKFSLGIRIILGSALTLALLGTISYYLGIAGLNLKFHPYFLPIVIILIGGFLYYKHEQGRIRKD